ncbi:unnamed protein product, partial [Iphiclides podalirius]
MKLLVLCCAFVGVLAEPPRFRPARFRYQRQELAPTTTDSPTEPTTETESSYSGGPYPPSGWKPAGEPFSLPNENQEPADAYGTPSASGPYPPAGWKPAGQPFNLPQGQQPPDNAYGPPDSTYGTPTGAPTTETTENPQAEKLEGPVDVQKSVGTYYVLLPSGQLQKVEFLTENDIQNMRITCFVIIQCVLVFAGSATVFNCIWSPDKATEDYDKLARIMYLYDSAACGRQIHSFLAISNLRLSNDTRGFKVLPIRWQPAIITVTARFSATTRW